jgi:hypothetical protein
MIDALNFLSLIFVIGIAFCWMAGTRATRYDSAQAYYQTARYIAVAWIFAAGLVALCFTAWTNISFIYQYTVRGYT